MTAPVGEAADGTILAAKSRRLATSYRLSDGDRATVDDLVESIYREISQEIRDQDAGKNYYPYVLVSFSGVVIDPTSLEPVVSLNTRYDIA